MDLATIVGLVIGWGAILAAVIIEGGELRGFLNLSAFVLVFFGTYGATMISFSIKDMVGLVGVTRQAFFGKQMELGEMIRTLVGFAEKARREGLLVLEEDLEQLGDEFLRKGVQLAVDGTDPEMVREILETEIEHLAARHHTGESIYATMGGFAPTLGIIGTVMGLVHMLANLSDPGSMGPAIAAAFIATLYGVSIANLVFLPISNKLKARNAEELAGRQMTVEGILAIQSGDNPRIVEEKLKSFLPPKMRQAIQVAGQRES